MQQSLLRKLLTAKMKLLTSKNQMRQRLLQAKKMWRHLRANQVQRLLTAQKTNTNNKKTGAVTTPESKAHEMTPLSEPGAETPDTPPPKNKKIKKQKNRCNDDS